MGKRDYFPMFFKYRDSLADLTDEQVGRVVRASIDYASDGVIPKLLAVEMMAFSFIRGDIDRARIAYEERCERNRDNARKRWESGEDGSEDDDYATACETYENMRPHAIDANTNKTNKTNKQSPSEGDTRARARGGKGKKAGHGEGEEGFAAPTADEVRHYCEEAGITLNADRFIEHYGSLGWMKAGSPIRDWKALARKWAREDKEKAEQAKEADARNSSFETSEFFDAALVKTYGNQFGFEVGDV